MAVDPLDPTYPLYERIVNDEAPRNLLVDASRGRIPFDDEAMGEIFGLLLQRRKDREILANVLGTIKHLPPEVVANYAQNRKTDPVLLDAIARLNKSHEDVLRRVVLNRATPDSSFVFVAKHCPPAIQRLIANNEERLLREPEIVDNLLENPNIDNDVRMQVLLRQEERLAQARKRQGEFAELEDELDLDEDDLFDEDIDDLDLDDDEDLDDDLDDDELEDLGTTGLGYLPAGSQQPVQQQAAPAPPQGGTLFEKVRQIMAAGGPDAYIDDEDEEEELSEDEQKSLQEELNDMNQADKEILAKTGNGTIRSYLIKDSSKQVAVAVINSPKVQEEEIIKFANLRNVHRDVLREIGRHREWAKLYSVKLALAKNPATPYDVAFSKLRMLYLHDLKAIAGSREVSGAISTAAKKIVANKERRRG